MLSSPPPSTVFSASVPGSPFLPDSGATHVLLRASSLRHLAPFFTPGFVPPTSFDLPNGAILRATAGGTLRFPHHAYPIPCFVCPDADLHHNLFSVSTLTRPNGTATFTNATVTIHTSPKAPPFLTGRKAPDDGLWAFDLPSLPSTSSIPPVTLQLSRQTALNVVPHVNSLADASYVAYQHRSLGSPAISTFLKAVRAGHLLSLRRLSASLIPSSYVILPHLPTPLSVILTLSVRTSAPHANPILLLPSLAPSPLLHLRWEQRVALTPPLLLPPV